jgi:conjugal transfer/entry exclusion protein
MKKMLGIEEAGEMVEEVENQIMNYSNAIKDMDKKMSYNLRLISSMIYNQPEKENGEISNLMK